MVGREAAAAVLHRLRQAEPFALFRRVEAVETDGVVGDLGLDHERGGGAGVQFCERRSRALHEIADAADVEDAVILGEAVDEAGQLADHDAIATSIRARVPARCACAMAQASASAASACSTRQVGNRRRTIAWTCSFCAWPTPTTDFLIWLGAYSAISRPACAAASSATARAWPILSA